MIGQQRKDEARPEQMPQSLFDLETDVGRMALEVRPRQIGVERTVFRIEHVEQRSHEGGYIVH